MYTYITRSQNHKQVFYLNTSCQVILSMKMYGYFNTMYKYLSIYA